MALLPCTECQTQISDKANACPHCGAPVSKLTTAATASATQPHSPATSKIGKIVLTILIAAVILSAFGFFGRHNASEQTKQEASPPAREPFHYYSLHRNGEYGYESDISEDERKRGVATKALVMVRYLGRLNGAISVVVHNGEQFIVLSCKEPCDFVNVQNFDHGQLSGDTLLKRTPNSLINGVMSDAAAGLLETYQVAGVKYSGDKIEAVN